MQGNQKQKKPRQMAQTVVDYVDALPEEERAMSSSESSPLAESMASVSGVAPDLPAALPLLRMPDQHRTNLPAQATPLIGREQEVADVCAILRSPAARLLTLSGPGGIGKTRLALQLAADLLDDFADGVYFVALASITDPALVPSAIAQVLGVQEAGSQPLHELLHEYLHDKHLLVVLDNVEQVLEAGSYIADVLERAPRLKVVITSRTILHLYGEHEYVVPPLALPDPAHLPVLERLAQYEAVRLFVERAQAAKADFAITDASALTIAEICVRLDGLPLAIELAAARIKIVAPSALLARLSSRLNFLTGGASNVPARQQTLRNTIAWSYGLLDNREQQVFARLAVFTGGCTLAAAAAVCEADDDRDRDLLDELASLIDKSLLRQVEQAHGDHRFVMLETIREYALERLVANGEAEIVQRRHCDYFLQFAETSKAALRHSQQGLWLTRLEADHDNARAALGWALGRGDVEVAARLVCALCPFWWIHSYLSEGWQWITQILDNSCTLSPADRAQVLHVAGLHAAQRGDNVHALALSNAALDLFRELNDGPGLVKALNSLGSILATSGTDNGRARLLLEEALDLSRDTGDEKGISYALNGLGIDDFSHGRYAQARLHFEQSLALDRTRGDKYDIGLSLANLLLVALSEGDVPHAEQLTTELRTLSAAIGNQMLTAYALEGQAAVVGTRGQPVLAARLFGAAEALWEAIGASLPPIEQAVFEPHVAAARTGLGSSIFDTVWAEGRAMTPEQALAGQIQAPLQEPSPQPPSASPYVLFTQGEVEVLRLVGQGLTDAQVAERLILSPRTINAHLASVYSKLGVNSRTAAIRFAIEHGLV
jgi:predicted ATPase/DNA-binding CsgD family transcriptional regulator